MTDHFDVESAIIDAEGASAVLELLQMDLTTSTVGGWRALGLEPRDDLHVIAISQTEYRAFHYAMDNIQHAVAEVSRLFYAEMKERAQTAALR